VKNSNLGDYIRENTVFIITLDLQTNFDADPKDLYVGSVLLEPGSLLLIGGEMNERFMHGIKRASHDEITDRVFNRPAHIPIGTLLPRGKRISITCASIEIKF
jgi:hypothetical protein